MQFNSLTFIVFFAIVTIIGLLVQGRFRWMLFLAASITFYYTTERFVLLLIGVSTIGYLCAIIIEKNIKPRLFLTIGIVTSLIPLLYYKYAGFFTETVLQIVNATGIGKFDMALHLMLPIGISFYTFQVIGYIIDVYRKEIPAEKNFGIYLTFITFFPQLVAGPIEKASHLIPQIRAPRNATSEDYFQGIFRILLGLFKKAVIADTIAIIADMAIGTNPISMNHEILIGIFVFAIQIYFDFSGYCDIAIGCAQILGIRLTENFNKPYFATSFADFWRRWHITLYDWLREYIYIPLIKQGSTKGINIQIRMQKINEETRNIMTESDGNKEQSSKEIPRSSWAIFCILVTFSISGLWHGADWHFIAWGFLMGVCVAVERVTRVDKKIPLLMYRVIVLGGIGFGWFLFRIVSFETIWNAMTSSWFNTDWSRILIVNEIWIMGILTALYFLGEYFVETKSKILLHWYWIRPIVSASLLIIIVLFHNMGGRTFIYFAF